MKRIAIVFFALVLRAAADALVICGSCGTEAAAGARFCSHCGAALAVVSAPEPEPAPGAATTPAAGAADGADIAALGTGAVRECVLAARKQFQEGRPDVARVLYRDALAIAGVDPGILPPAQGERLQQETDACDERLSSVLAECTACHGTGRRSLQATGLGGSAVSGSAASVSSGIRCEACGGTGKRQRRRTVGERKTALGQGTQAAETVFRSLRFVQEGNAWIPQSLAPLLSLEQRCRLRRAAALPCPDCQGFGLADCRTCGATGTVPCKAKGCDNGWILSDPTSTLDSKAAAIKTRKPCPTCGGTAQVTCSACAGRGAQTCRKCEGSGRRTVCHTCGGDGTGQCASCRGTGTTRSGKTDVPCTACGGTGRGFCRTCHGEGYGR